MLFLFFIFQQQLSTWITYHHKLLFILGRIVTENFEISKYRRCLKIKINFSGVNFSEWICFNLLNYCIVLSDYFVCKYLKLNFKISKSLFRYNAKMSIVAFMVCGNHVIFNGNHVKSFKGLPNFVSFTSHVITIIITLVAQFWIVFKFWWIKLCVHFVSNILRTGKRRFSPENSIIFHI